ncbi:hypothetical protein DSUL_100081 [Desulfovibrionales bacterium]
MAIAILSHFFVVIPLVSKHTWQSMCQHNTLDGAMITIDNNRAGLGVRIVTARQ